MRLFFFFFMLSVKKMADVISRGKQARQMRAKYMIIIAMCKKIW